MKQSEINALMRGIAPAIEQLMARAVEPLVQRMAEVERGFVTARRPDGVRSAVTVAIEAALPLEVRTAVDAALPVLIAEAVGAMPLPAPGKDADPDLVRQMVAEAVSALPVPEPGKDADPETVRQMIVEEVAALPTPENGKDADPSEVERQVIEAVERAVAALEKPKDGTSVTIDDVAPLVERAVADAVAALPSPEPGPPGAPGKLGVVRAWEDTVFYDADVVTFEGAIYQAQRDTGRQPPHDDWLCIVARGEAGEKPAEIEVTGTFDAAKAYAKLNVVALNGGSFIAKRDDPGECPGDGWQLIASQGKRGLPGEATRGDPGRPGPAIRAMNIDDQGMLTLINADGSKVECDLYPLLSQIASTQP